MKKPPHKRKFNGFGTRAPGSFVKLDYGLLNTEAWQHLTPRACKLYIAVRIRCNGMNNGTISYSIGEAIELLKCSPNTACGAFDELMDKGFLKCARSSTFTLKTKEARLWTITVEKIGDKPPTRDFKDWPQKNTVIERITHGYREDNREVFYSYKTRPTVIEGITVMPKMATSRLS